MRVYYSKSITVNCLFSTYKRKKLLTSDYTGPLKHCTLTRNDLQNKVGNNFIRKSVKNTLVLFLLVPYMSSIKKGKTCCAMLYET